VGEPDPGRRLGDELLIELPDGQIVLGDRSLATFTAFVVKDLSESGSVIVHDRCQNYDSAALGTLIHQLCTAHLLRDLRSILPVPASYRAAVLPGARMTLAYEHTRHGKENQMSLWSSITHAVRRAWRAVKAVVRVVVRIVTAVVAIIFAAWDILFGFLGWPPKKLRYQVFILSDGKGPLMDPSNPADAGELRSAIDFFKMTFKDRFNVNAV